MSKSVNSPLNTFLLTLVGGLVLFATVLFLSSRDGMSKMPSSAETDDITSVVTSRVAPDAHTNNEQQAGSAVKMVTVASTKQRQEELKKKIAEATLKANQ